jgi:hypothetical protein
VKKETSQVSKVFNYYGQLSIKYQDRLYQEILKYYRDEEMQKIDS